MSTDQLSRVQDGYGSRRAAGAPRRHTPVLAPVLTFATVLFFDVKDSTALSHSMSLDAWWSAMDDLFGRMCEAVHEYGGEVAEFTGDGISAIFEDDESPASHAERACEAALSLREQVSGRRAGVQLSIRTGINSGEVMRGTIGRRSHCHYAIAGYAVALAKRIESLALEGRIYVSEHTASLIAGVFELTQLGAMAVKGAPAPVEVHELVRPIDGVVRV